MQSQFPLLTLLVMAAFTWIGVSAGPYKTLVAPITKDTTTSLYSVSLNSRESYVIDVNAPFLWRVCGWKQPPVACSSPACSQGRTYPSSLCSSANNSFHHGRCVCNVTPVNPIAKTCATAQLTFTDLAVSWTNGKNPTVTNTFKNIYVSCAPSSLLNGLPSGSAGVAGFSKAPLALSTQLTPSYLGLSKKFALCLPSTANGAVFFGDGPYYFIAKPTQFDAMTALTYTPLVQKPNSQEYFIGVQGISINAKPSKFRPNAFGFDAFGRGGVKLSTVVPYTTLRSDIYKTLLDDFKMATKGIPVVKKISKTFGLCLRTGPVSGWGRRVRIPNIDIELGYGKKWSIVPINSMKQISSDVSCLAVMDGGKTAPEAIVIGTYQMENTFFSFDLGASTLGFSSSLSLFGTSCNNFNFTAAS